MRSDAAEEWAYEHFRGAELPDDRLRARLIRMATAAARAPGGRVLEVFKTSAERQGAYDFLENPRVQSDRIGEASFGASARVSADFPYVFVAMDGSSLTVTDRLGRKGFGSVGTSHRPATGLHSINAYALEPDGTPIGVVGQTWWARPASKRRQDHKQRGVSQRETQRWLDTACSVTGLFEQFAPQTRAWFVVDREGDGIDMLTTLERTGHFFTVRSKANRVVKGRRGETTLQQKLGVERVRFHFDLKCPVQTGQVALRKWQSVPVTSPYACARTRRGDGRTCR
jgi:hypothetical protein